FDRPGAGQGDASGDGNSLVDVLRVDEEVAAQLLPRFRKGPVGHERLAIADADAGRRRRELKRRGSQVLACGVELVREVGGFTITLLALRLTEGVLVSVDQQHVFHDVSPVMSSAHREARAGRNAMVTTVSDGMGTRWDSGSGRSRRTSRRSGASGGP